MIKLYDNLLRRVHQEIPLRHFLAKSAIEARSVLKRERVDLIILDWMLPGVGGLEFIQEIRAKPEHKDILIIMVTAKGSAHDCAEALDAGADDFLSKPFNIEVLLARLRSLSRRKERVWQEAAPIEHGGIRLDPAQGLITVSGKPVHLHPKGMLLLEIFLRRPDVLHTSRELWDHCWAYDSDNWEHVLVTTISSLKKRLGPKKGSRLECRRGLGYIFRSS
jgi:two-component system phosphate regulon response regulator PhoB